MISIIILLKYEHFTPQYNFNWKDMQNQVQKVCPQALRNIR